MENIWFNQAGVSPVGGFSNDPLNSSVLYNDVFLAQGIPRIPAHTSNMDYSALSPADDVDYYHDSHVEHEMEPFNMDFGNLHQTKSDVMQLSAESASFDYLGSPSFVSRDEEVSEDVAVNNLWDRSSVSDDASIEGIPTECPLLDPENVEANGDALDFPISLDSFVENFDDGVFETLMDHNADEEDPEIPAIGVLQPEAQIAFSLPEHSFSVTFLPNPSSVGQGSSLLEQIIPSDALNTAIQLSGLANQIEMNDLETIRLEELVPVQEFPESASPAVSVMSGEDDSPGSCVSSSSAVSVSSPSSSSSRKRVPKRKKTSPIDKAEKKKHQNREAAHRYREKKRLELAKQQLEVDELMRLNSSLVSEYRKWQIKADAVKDFFRRTMR